MSQDKSDTKTKSAAPTGQIIPFPGVKAAEVRAAEAAPAVPAGPRRGSHFAALSLMGFMVLAAWLFAQQGPGHHEGSHSLASRNPAQASELQETDDWQGMVLQRISGDVIRGTASIGQEPTDGESLQFGFLKGKYSLEMESGRVRRIRFQTFAEGDQPEYLGDRLAFIIQRKKLWPVDFEEVRLLASEKRESERVETYDLIAADQAQVGEIKVRLDEHSRLLGVEVN